MFRTPVLSKHRITIWNAWYCLLTKHRITIWNAWYCLKFLHMSIRSADGFILLSRKPSGLSVPAISRPWWTSSLLLGTRVRPICKRNCPMAALAYYQSSEKDFRSRASMTTTAWSKYSRLILLPTTFEWVVRYWTRLRPFANLDR